MRRRQFLGATGAVLAASGSLSTGVGARATGELPTDDVSHTRVHPFSDDQPVPAGDWLVHTIAWVDSEDPEDPDGRDRDGDDSTESDVEHFLEVIDLDAWIDGEPVPDAEDYWGEPFEADDGRWYVVWKYATPPKPPGEHSLRIRQTFTEAHEGGYEAGDSTDLIGRYQVQRGR